MFYDPADRFHVVQYFLCVSQPGYEVIQVAMEIVGLLYCLFQFRLKMETKDYTMTYTFRGKLVFCLCEPCKNGPSKIFV